MRTVTPREARKVARLAARHDAVFNTTGHQWLSSLAALGTGFAGVAFIDFWIDATHAGVTLPTHAWVALLVGGGSLLALAIRHSRLAARLHREMSKEGNRYAISDSGLSVDLQGAVSFYSWPSMELLWRDEKHCFFYVAKAQVISLLKSAFEGQDFAGFCEEAENLWRANRHLAADRAPASPVYLQSMQPPEHRPAPVLELRQTRDFTPQERREMGILLRKRVWPRNLGKLYMAMSYAFMAASILLALLVFSAVRILDSASSTLALPLAGAAIAYIVLYRILTRLAHRESERKNWGGAHAGDCYYIELDGIRGTSARGSSTSKWPGIPAIIQDEKYLVVMLSESIAMFIAKDAFADQDVDGFCAELVRRWRASRETAQPKRAT